MRDRNKILIIVLAIVLAWSNVALSGHVSSHSASDTGLCTLCIQKSGSDNAIEPQSSISISYLASSELSAGDPPVLAWSVDVFDYQSRAPPPVPE
jgi:hypothetical protein